MVGRITPVDAPNTDGIDPESCGHVQIADCDVRVSNREYQSVDPTGAPIDVSKRLAVSRQITDAEATMMRDKGVVFGLPAWNPMP